MRVFGFEITRQKAAQTLQTVTGNGGGWYPLIREAKTGNWQRNIEVRHDSVMSFHADFACRTLIASDIAKLRIKLVQQDDNGIWIETKNPAYSPVLRKPNHFQTRVQFMEHWMLSKLQTGNTYVLKRRDGRGVVNALYVLDPTRVTILRADDGSIFYRLQSDNSAGQPTQIDVPAREMIHDRFNTQGDPMVGISPIMAHALSSTQGLNIQTESALLFKNQAMPSGLLVAPTNISNDDAKRLKDQWYDAFGGDKRGSVGALGNGVKFEKLPFTAVEGQLIEQLKYTAEIVCGVYHVPAFMVMSGVEPNYNNVQNLTLRYYSQCLQVHLEAIEVCLDEGLGMAEGLGTEFDQDNLLRMDSVTQADVLDKLRNVMKPNEARAKLSLPATEGGDDVYRQMQDFSLSALKKRDAMADPFGTAAPAPAPPKTVSPFTVKTKWAGRYKMKEAA